MLVRRVAVLLLVLVSVFVSTGSAQSQEGPVELVSARTEYSSTFANPDGSRTLVLHTGPVHVRDGRGGWRPVDLTLRPGAEGRIEPVAHPRELSFGGAGSTELVRMTDGQTRFSRPWPTPLPAPVLARSSATYPGARPGQDLVVTATRTGFTQRLVPSGGSGTRMAGELVGPGGESGLVAEPASVSLGPVLDAYVQSNILTAPMGHQPDVRVGTFDGTIVARSFLGWQLPELRGKAIRRAELKLWNWHSWSCQPRGWQVWETGAPDAKTAWSRQPEWKRQIAGSTKTLGYSTTCPDGTVGVEVTGLVREWAGGGAALGGLGLRAADEADVFAWKKWSASEGAEGHPPRLEVTYQHG